VELEPFKEHRDALSDLKAEDGSERLAEWEAISLHWPVLPPRSSLHIIVKLLTGKCNQ
jgi:hypothetical protein